jgi:hypothetical protein
MEDELESEEEEEEADNSRTSVLHEGGEDEKATK